MAVMVLPQDVADAFVKQYYAVLNKCPENAHKFYQESSLLGWPGTDGVVTPVTTLSGINDRIMSSDYKNCSVDIEKVDAQKSLEGGVVVAVTGSLTGNDNVIKHFSQTFFLAVQERGFFVLNDILHFINVCGSVTTTDAANDEDLNVLPATSVLGNISEGHASSDTKLVLENGKVEETFDLSILKEPAAKGPYLSSPVGKDHSVVAPASPVEKDHSVVAPASPVEKDHSVVAPASNVKEDAKKITYASVVAKEATVTSARTHAPVVASKTPVASPKTKAPAALGVAAPKVSNSNSTVSKAPSPSSKMGPKLPTASNEAPNNSARVEAKGIYIGGLPYDITKQGIVDVLKKFGPVRRHSDTIQIRRHEDGFCCAFVEFESADGARCAVEAHHVKFGEKEAYMTYKRSTSNRGDNGRGRTPPRSGPRNGNFRGRENGEVSTTGGFQKKTALFAVKGQAVDQEAEQGWRRQSRSHSK